MGILLPGLRKGGSDVLLYHRTMMLLVNRSLVRKLKLCKKFASTVAHVREEGLGKVLRE